MPSFLYVGDDERFYPSLNLTVKPGDTFVADANPDPPHFDEVGADGQLNEQPPPAADPIPAEPAPAAPAEEA